jgi:signal transduction histidine kinase
MPHTRAGGNRPPGDRAEELLAMIAHELRRPLTALLGALATVQQRGPALATAQQQELLGVANRQATQLQRLLDQLLAAAGLDHPQAGMAHRSLQDVAALAQEAGIAARLAHPDHPVTIEVAGPLLVHTDSLAISRILGNLLDNAATHSPPGAPIRLVAGRDGAQAVLAVQDQGPGIPPEERGRIFERYARLDWPTGPPTGGLGLGLYIARRLAGANCGELHATDAPSGRGARFELRLPLALPAPDRGPTTLTSGEQPPPTPDRRRP